IHAGDAYSPSILASFDKGAHMVELLNMVKPDVFTPGNHEFDFGPDVFRKRIAESAFPCLSANLSEKNGKPVEGVRATQMFSVGPFRVGVVGATTEETVHLSSPGDELVLRPAVASVRAQAKRLRAAGADIVVAVTHVGFDDDLALVRSRAVDVVLSGHDHNLITIWDRKVLLVESASQGDFITPIDLMVTRRVRQGRKTVSFVPNVRPIDSATVKPEPLVDARVKALEAELDKNLDVAIGTTATAFDTVRATLRGRENAFANMMCDAMREATGAALCLINAGGIRAARRYRVGETLTRKMIFAELPFGNRTVVVKLSGADLKAALEHGFHGPQVGQGHGRFPQIGGFRVVVDRNRADGKRVVAVTLDDGTPLDPKAMYEVAISRFMARGGDGYAMFKRAPRIIDELAARYSAGQIIRYVRKRKRVSPRIEGRIRFTGS
ncbi:MAG: 5'-nucleotidase C-terminal domain-containing protein, partial [Pseudomonadota bacterium]